jgi:exopolyphosphatase / guanosine-5'-triphosphate,3'-diphosphate pyrophosphatase
MGVTMLSNQAQRLAIIDLGSNTARLVVLSTVPGYAYNLNDEIREVVRLREGMTEDGLSETAVRRALFTLRLFKRFCDGAKIDKIIATATSAVREASNGALFVEQVERDIGLSLQILDGSKEAYYGVIGALNEVPLADGFVVDIGGGSAQLSEVRDRRFQRGTAVRLGSLALTELFVRSDPLDDHDYGAVIGEINRQLDKVDWLVQAKPVGDRHLVGLGGTIRNLARMGAVRQGYPLNTLQGYAVSRDSLNESIRQLKEKSLAKRRKIPGLNSDRADIILPGALVMQIILDRLGMEQFIVSVNGLREGLFFERFWQHLSYPVAANIRRFSVLNMARVYSYEKAHANHVRYLAGRLYEQLMPLHGYGRAELEILDAAALLHDLGTIIDYYDHHKHSQRLITNRGLAGFTPRETALIALLARYHRKGKPRLTGFELLLAGKDKMLLTRLAAILRLAEFLERGRNANVDDVAAFWDDSELRLTVIADEYPAVELWEAEKNAASLMETAFERQLVLESTAAPAAWMTSMND